MERNTLLVQEYRMADDEKRLYLFLAHPVLRERFMEIEKSENESDIRHPDKHQPDRNSR